MLKARDFFRGVPSSLTSTLGLWRGTSVIKENIGRAPESALLKLYDMEGCPFCRLAREALTELDLDAEIIPVAKGDEKVRAELKALGGKVQMPFLVDANTGQEMYESFDIVNYLYAQYGNGKQRSQLTHSAALLSSMLTSASRLNSGITYSGLKKPEQPLELYSFESSPFSRPVRERLTELGIPYILRNLGKQQMSDMGPPEFRFTTKPYVPVQGSKRDVMNTQFGKVQVPYLVDVNTGEEMFESWDIIRYLDRTYG